MEEKFLGGKTDSLKIEFNERRRFLKFLRERNLESEYPYLDTLYDKKLYGRVDEKGNILIPVPEPKRFGQYAAAATGLNYTVKLFNNFRQFFLNSTSFSPPEQIVGLIPKKSYSDFEESYRAYELKTVNKILPNIIDYYKDYQQIYFTDFISDVLSLSFEQEFSDICFTKSGFALSADCNVYNTGLYVDFLPNLSATEDQKKIDFYSDLNFECYSKVAYEFGFFVDAHCPWRLIVNKHSDAFKLNILNGRPQNEFDNFYADVYTMKVALDDYWSMKSLYEALYVETLRQLEIEILQVETSAPVDQWLETLLSHRFKELHLTTSIQSRDSNLEFSRTLQKAKEINSEYGLSSNFGSLNFISTFFAKKIERMMRKSNDFTSAGFRVGMYGDSQRNSNYIGTI